MQPGCASLRLLSLVVLFSLATSLGCGSGSSRLPVSGTVTGPGTEAIAGSVSFTPAQGNSGPGAVVSLAGGKYQFDRATGPQAGPHDVIITRALNKLDLERVRSADRNAKTRWNFTADVPAKGPYKFDFKLD